MILFFGSWECFYSKTIPIGANDIFSAQRNLFSIMKIASFNVNGIRARLPIVREWLVKEKPDIICLQETKVRDSEFPKEVFDELGYFLAFRGEKGYNGVAIVCQWPLTDVCFGFGDGDYREEVRIITAAIGNLTIVNTYVPQGFAPDSEKFRYKLEWFHRLYDYFSLTFKPDAPLLWVGDFNVAPEPRDVYDPKGLFGRIGFHPDEHSALAQVKKWGFVDVFRKYEQGEGFYTFWDYRVPQAVKRGLGWRIDHIWATSCLAEKLVCASIDRALRLAKKPSDHTVIWAEFKI